MAPGARLLAAAGLFPHRCRRIVEIGVEYRLQVPVARRAQPRQRVGACGLEPLLAVLFRQVQNRERRVVRLLLDLGAVEYAVDDGRVLMPI